MIKLKQLEDVTFQCVLDACDSDIITEPLKRNLSLDKPELIKQAEDYRYKANLMQLHLIKGIKKTDDELITDNLTKENLKSLYKYYFCQRPKGKLLRDKILATVRHCPFCGSLSSARTLDHFLPQAHFPQFSILPDNLVPACSDCNSSSKGSSYAIKEEKQILHPYFEDDKFYKEQWIKAKYNASTESSPCTIEFYVDPPTAWSDIDKKRVQCHFDTFQVGEKYSNLACDCLPEIEGQIKICKSNPIEAILEPTLQNRQNANDWKRIVCLAIKEVLIMENFDDSP